MIMKILKYCLIFLLPLVLGSISFYLKSSYLSDNLSKILLPILLAILAITNTSLALVIGKLQELANKISISFEKTHKEIKNAYVYQIINIVIATITLILLNSKEFLEFYKYIHPILDAILLICLSISLSILFDIWNSIFEIIKGIAKLK